MEIFSKKKKNIFFLFSSLCFVGTFVFYVTPLVFTAASTAPHTSELAFVEKSKDNSLIGSVIPASCESSPRVAHFAGDLAPCTPNCPLPWGGSIPYGSSVTAYSAPTVLYPNVCTWQVRTCGFDGVLTGSFMYPGCSVNMPPVVNAGIDRLITQPTSASAPAGAMASDPEGGPISMMWTNTVRPVGAGPVEIRNGNMLVPSFASLNTVGTYVFMLSATDNVGLSSSDTMNVTVQAPAATPTEPTNVPPSGNIFANGMRGAVSIPTGGNATITWNSYNTTDCRVLEGSLQIGTGTNNNTGINRTPTTAILYSLICDGTNGATNVLIDVVSVNPASGLPPDIYVDRRVVPEGDGVNLTWNLNGGTGPCVLYANNISVPGYSNIIMNGGYAVPSVNVTTTYQIQCPSGSDSVRVEIIPRGFET